MAQYVFQMQQVGKIVPPQKKILRDISLSFFPGAKIGVLGLNGSGKSTLLKIMAGVDTEIEGEATPQKGLKIGYLPQEPELDCSKNVRGNVEAGLGQITKLLERFNEISLAFSEPMDDDKMTALLEEQGELQNEIDTVGGMLFFIANKVPKNNQVYKYKNIFQFKVIKASARRIESLEIKKLF